jgi:hypothetical protein
MAAIYSANQLVASASFYPSQAHPVPLRQVYERLMQLSPQAFPLLHTLQHAAE